MKKTIMSVMAILIISIATAQTQTVYKNFDKVQVDNVNGKVSIIVGKEFDVQVTPDNKESNPLKIEQLPEGVLKFSFTKSFNWYSNPNNVNIKIAMPDISKLYNSSNADVSISNFKSKYLSIENEGNGMVTLNGTNVHLLDIANGGNGDVIAKGIVATKTNIVKAGNGNVELNCTDNFEVTMSGNGDVINWGKGKAIIKKKSGNGDIIYKQ